MRTLFLILLSATIAQAQIDANDHVTIDGTNKLVIFHSAVLDATFTYDQLKDAALTTTGDAQIVSTTKVQRFTQMQQVYNDQKPRVDHLGSRQDNIKKLLLQLGSIITRQQEELSTLTQWLERALYQEGATPTPAPEPTLGQTRTNPETGDFELYDGTQWVIISRAKVTLEEEQ